MAVTQYIGSRYVPIFADPAEWSNAKEYEPLTIVLHEGNSFTSKQFVPVGIDIDNETYWAETGNYNAQVEQYRRDVSQYRTEVQNVQETVSSHTDEIEGLDDAIERLGIQVDLIDAGYGFSGAVHHSQGKMANGQIDTSWLLIRLPREKVTMSEVALSGNDSDPKTLSSNAYEYAKAHPEYWLVTNSNYGGNDYPMRFKGNNYSGTNLTRPYLGFSDADPMWFPVGTSIPSVGDQFDTIYAVDEYLINNHVINPNLDAASLNKEPRNAFGWDSQYYYLFFCEGRGMLERGLLLSEVANIGQIFNIQHFVNLDGGGSICFACNSCGTRKVNLSRDFSEVYNQLRATGVGNAYRLADGIPNNVLDTVFNAYRSGSNGYIDYHNYVGGPSSSQQITIEAGAFSPIPSGTRKTGIFDQFEFAEGYAFDNTMSLPVPIKRYAEQPIYYSGSLEILLPANTVIESGVLYVSTVLETDGEVTTYRSIQTVVNPSTSAQRLTIPLAGVFRINVTNRTEEIKDRRIRLMIFGPSNGKFPPDVRVTGGFFEVKIESDLV